MALDPAVVGNLLPGHEVFVERGRLRFFANAIGEIGRASCRERVL